MCTVTYIPAKDSVFITHSRDEKQLRPRAVPPRIYRQGGRNILFPKDSLAGGSWVAVNENGQVAVLLNGGFVKHTPSPPYRKSRGLIFLELAASDNLPDAWQQAYLDNIEPFTLILSAGGKLSECRWDGQRKYRKQLDPSRPHIWSSVTLYDEASAARRKGWFDVWLSRHPEISQQDIIGFHLSAGDGDQHNDIRMNRAGHLLTVSISGIQSMPHHSYFRYLDLLAGTQFYKEINFLTGNAELKDVLTTPTLTRNTHQ